VLDAASELEALLSGEERNRLARYRRPEDRQRSLLGRGVLRLVLGAWLGLDPASLRLATGPHGKPELVEPGPPSPQFKTPQFNISHTGDLILLAFHATDPVGVDGERQRPPDWDWRPIARRCLDPSTVESLLALPPAEAARAFVEAWCDLEAGLKARGLGLARANDGRSRAMERRLRRWRLALPAGYAGAVALLDPG
jgi:4'-phosphopantetheinyl transferase